MDTKKSTMRNLFGPGPARSFPSVSPEALERGQQSIAAQAPVYNTTSSETPNTKPFIRLPFKPAGGRKSRKLGNKFNRCVKSVRSTVKARKGSNKESAAIAICTTSVLYPRGRTIKRYQKKRLITQKKFRGGEVAPRPSTAPREGSVAEKLDADKRQAAFNEGIDRLTNKMGRMAEKRLGIGQEGDLANKAFKQGALLDRRLFGSRRHKSKRYTRRR